MTTPIPDQEKRATTGALDVAAGQERDADVSPSLPSVSGVANEREHSRLIGGKAMSPESIALYRDPEVARHAGESGSQGNTLGRENQNPISGDTGLTGHSERNGIGAPGDGDER